MTDLPVSGPGLGKRMNRWMRGASPAAKKAAKKTARKMAAARNAKAEKKAAAALQQKQEPPRYCICGAELGLVDVNPEARAFVCDVIGCSKYRTPQGYIQIGNSPSEILSKAQAIIDRQLQGKAE